MSCAVSEKEKLGFFLSLMIKNVSLIGKHSYFIELLNLLSIIEAQEASGLLGPNFQKTTLSYPSYTSHTIRKTA